MGAFHRTAEILAVAAGCFEDQWPSTGPAASSNTPHSWGASWSGRGSSSPPGWGGRLPGGGCTSDGGHCQETSSSPTCHGHLLSFS